MRSTRGRKAAKAWRTISARCASGCRASPALAHRLDRDTSGCLVLGRHRKALATLGKLFKDGKVGKTYWAVVEGGPAEDEGRIELAARPARRHPRLVDEGRSRRGSRR